MWIFRKSSNWERNVGCTRQNAGYVEPENWTSSDKRSSIVFYFGGGWNTRHITQFVAFAQYYTSKGLVCFIPNYRVRSTDNSQAIDSLEDAQDAFAFVRKNSKKFGIDPNRIASSGGSAGGHLAASLGTIEDIRNRKLSFPNAMILFNPGLILEPKKNPNEWYSQDNRLGTEPIKISPYHHINENTPPTIIYHGTDDKITAFDKAAKFNAKMQDMGKDSTLVPFEGRDHGFFNHGKHIPGSDYHKTLEYTDEFLTRIGWLPLG